MKKTHKKEAGFTLIELALIIAVLGILGAVGAVKLASMTEEAKTAAVRTTLANARSAFAIGIAKETDGGVTTADMAKYMTGAGTTTDTTIEVEGKYLVTFEVDAQKNITNVASASVK